MRHEAGQRAVALPILNAGRGLIRIMAAVLVLAVFVHAGPASSGDTLHEVRVGIYDFKPLAFLDTDGKAKGFFIDILEDMAKQEKWSLTYVSGSFNQCLSRLKNGEIDLIAGIAYSDERAKVFEFTREHLFIIWAEIYTSPKSPVKTILDLEGKSVSLVKGAQVNKELKTLLEGFGISARFQEYEDYEAVLQSLEASAADAGVFTNLYSFRFLDTHPLTRTQIFFAPTQLRFAVGKNNGSNPISGIAVVETLDRYFSKYKADVHSVYHRAYDVWITPSGMQATIQKRFIPTWVYGLFFVLTVLSLLLMGFNRLSKRMVNIKTRELKQSRDLLQIQTTALRAGEAALKKQAYFLQKAQEIGCIGTWELDIRKNELTWTQENYKIFGLAPGTPLSYETFLNCVHPDDRAYVDKKWKAAFLKKPYDIEHRLVVEGKVKWVREKAELEFNEADECVRGIGFTQDITERKISEIQVREAVERFKNVFDSQFDAIFVLTTDVPAMVLECNQAAVDIFGYAPEDLIGEPVDKLHVDSSHLERFQTQLFSSIQHQGHLRQFEFSMKRKDGAIFPSEHTVVEMKADSGERAGWISMVRDLSQIKKTESALLESERIHRALIQSLPDVVMRFDREGRHLFVSENVGQVVDLKAEQFIGKTHRELGFPENQCRFWEETIQKVFDSGTPFETESMFEGKTGPVIHNWRLVPEGQSSGKVESVLSLSRDITSQRRAEQNYKTLFQEMLDGFALHEILCDPAGKPVDYRFLEVNPAFERMTGLKAEDIEGRTVLEVLPGTELHWIEAYGKVALTGEPVFFENYSADLNKYFEIRAFQPVPNRFACIFQDITASKQAEAEQMKLQAHLNQAQKMESIGTLAGGIAHDFNNILFPIVGHTEMLMDDIPEDGPVRSSLNEIYAGALRARDLVHQILSFSRQGETELQMMKLQPIVKEALKLIRATIPTSIAMVQNIQPGCGAVTADPTHIHQIVMNLTTNAYHAMEEGGGELKVSLEQIRWNRPDPVYPDMAPGVYACLTVADTGPGIPREIRDRIFEPFFTTKEKGKGTGMGLSVVHGIVKAMNGAVQVSSEPGRGTEFRVYLPVVGQGAEKKELLTREALPGGSEKVLLVDDEEAIIAMERQMLKRLGYDATACSGSMEALKTFRAGPDQFDLVITDMAMPTLSGDKLAVELIRIRPDIPVLLCTGFSETLTEERIKSLGIRGLVLKPIIMKDLALKIRDVLDGDKNAT
ncbi:MAG: PAS domain S-box protein [Desulfobacula sp.]|nr:PAS domain S-box protein [Desulfobacula sp.]